MSLFLTLMVVGLFGMLLMALPGVFRHGHIGGHGHDLGHGEGVLPHLTHTVSGHQAANVDAGGDADFDTPGALHFIPSPRVIFSFMAVYGAVGYALVGAGNLSVGLSALIALAPAVLMERLILNPLWKWMLQFQAQPAAPLEKMIMGEANAVTPFRNGRGMVSVEHDGRLLQMRAELTNDETQVPVKVGDRLRVVSVDSENERITVSHR